jgi:hypothetical protein
MVKRRLTKEAVFKFTHPDLLDKRKEFVKVMGLTGCGIWRALRSNKWNGTLTTETSLQFLEEALKMSRKQLLETVEDED